MDMAKLMAEWSPARAGECLSCQAGLCAEHGPATTATTTGAALHSVDCGTAYRGCAPDCPKDLAEPRCHCGAYATSDDEKTCCESGHAERIERVVARCTAPAPAAEASPCRCGAYTASECECRKHAPPVTPQLERDELGRLCVNGRPHYPADPRMLGAPFCVVCYHPLVPAPAAEAKGEMSREDFEAVLSDLVYTARGAGARFCAGDNGRGNELLQIVRAKEAKLVTHDLALRTRAREAEERAERTTEHLLNSVARAVQRGDELERERDEATTRAKVADRTAEEWEAARDSDVDAVWAEVADAAMKAWDKPQPYNDSPAELIAKIINERDEAREQRDAAKGEALNEKARADTNDELCDSFMKSSRKHAEERDTALGTVTSLRFDLAAANARAEEAEKRYDRLRDISLCRLQFPDGTVPGGTEECARGWHQWYGAADARAESLRARLAAAEAEVKRLGHLVETSDERERGIRGEAGRLREEVKRLSVAPCPICVGQPHPSGKLCACGGTNSVYRALEYLLGEHERASADLEAAQDAHTRAVVALTGPRCYDPSHGGLVERCRRLVEAGDKMAALGTWPTACGWSLRDAWCAAKGGGAEVSAGAERVLAEVAEAAEPLMPVNEWTVANQIVEQVERMRTWDRGFARPSAHRANLRQVLIGLAALCVAAIAALDAPAAGGGGKG